VNLSERDRRDLEELAGIFLSPAPTSPGAATTPAPAPAAGLCLLTSLDGGDEPRPALLRAARDVARPLPLPSGKPGAVHPLLRARTGPRRVLIDGPGVMPVPSTDGPVLRWGLAATSRILAWFPARTGLLRGVEDFLLVLHEACPGPELGWLRAPDLPPAPIEAVLASWRPGVPGARAVALGTWQPGEEFPPAAREFLVTAPPARLAPPVHTPRQAT